MIPAQLPFNLLPLIMGAPCSGRRASARVAEHGPHAGEMMKYMR